LADFNNFWHATVG